MGILCFQAVAFGMLLPETMGKSTLETMADLSLGNSNENYEIDLRNENDKDDYEKLI